jgi:hypothetical protein
MLLVYFARTFTLITRVAKSPVGTWEHISPGECDRRQMKPQKEHRFLQLPLPAILVKTTNVVGANMNKNIYSGVPRLLAELTPLEAPDKLVVHRPVAGLTDVFDPGGGQIYPPKCRVVGCEAPGPLS